eukprot:s313_g45.t1
MKRVQEGHTLADALEAVIKDPDLKEAYFTTPMALRASMPEVQPAKYQRFGNKGVLGASSIPLSPRARPKDPRAKERASLWTQGSKASTSHGGRQTAVSCVLLGIQVSVTVPAAVFISKCKLVLMEFDIERSPDHDLTDDKLWDRIFDLLKEGDWVLIVSPPCNTFSKARFQHQQHPGPKPLRTRNWPKGFPWLSNENKKKILEANLFVERCLKGCEIAAAAHGYFILEHPEDLGTVQGEQPGSIWQWEELLDLIPRLNAICFAIHQCMFGGLTPKPTRFLTNLQVNDKRCYLALPQFDQGGFYRGPLPRDCGHVHSHKLIGKTAAKWNTAPSASYPAGLCKLLASIILSSGGGRSQNAGFSVQSSDQKERKSKFAQPVQKRQKTLEAQKIGEKEESCDFGGKGESSFPPACIVCDSSSDERELSGKQSRRRTKRTRGGNLTCQHVAIQADPLK